MVGIRGRDTRGVTFTERGQMVVGADGRTSRVARLVEAPTYREHPAKIGVFYTYWAGVDVNHAEFHIRSDVGVP